MRQTRGAIVTRCIGKFGKVAPGAASGDRIEWCAISIIIQRYQKAAVVDEQILMVWVSITQCCAPVVECQPAKTRGLCLYLRLIAEEPAIIVFPCWWRWQLAQHDVYRIVHA